LVTKFSYLCEKSIKTLNKSYITITYFRHRVNSFITDKTAKQMSYKFCHKLFLREDTLYIYKLWFTLVFSNRKGHKVWNITDFWCVTKYRFQIMIYYSNNVQVINTWKTFIFVWWRKSHLILSLVFYFLRQWNIIIVSIDRQIQFSWYEFSCEYWVSFCWAL
jgi:hypothetical protein